MECHKKLVLRFSRSFERWGSLTNAGPEPNLITFMKKGWKIQAVTEELKKEHFEITLSTLVASELVTGEKIWRPKNYKD